MTQAIIFDHFSLGYRQKMVIDNLSMAIEVKTLLAIVGANGAGKSTLLKGIMGLLKPRSGHCQLDKNLTLAYLPQQSELNLTFPAQVIDLISLGLWRTRGLFKRHSSTDKQRIKLALSTVGLADYENRPLDTLSGGQLQRVLFARVCLQDADLILLDEPFNSVDKSTISDLMQIITDWHQQGKTVLAVLHDIELVKHHFKQVLLLNQQTPQYGDPNEILAASPLSKIG